MKKIVNRLLVLLAASIFVSPVMAQDGHEGHNHSDDRYQVLETPQPTTTGDRIEVVELFFYGCPHCYRLEPFIETWHKQLPDDVEFVRLPAILGKGWELMAKAYFTAELMGVLDKVHGPLFDSIHKNRQKYRNDREVRDFFVNQGIEGEEFDKMFNSFAVNVKLNNARLMTRRYKINGVPTMIVNGKYSTSASQAGGNQKLLELVDQLVEQERKQVAGTADSKAVATN